MPEVLEGMEHQLALVMHIVDNIECVAGDKTTGRWPLFNLSITRILGIQAKGRLLITGDQAAAAAESWPARIRPHTAGLGADL